MIDFTLWLWVRVSFTNKGRESIFEETCHLMNKKFFFKIFLKCGDMVLLLGFYITFIIPILLLFYFLYIFVCFLYLQNLHIIVKSKDFAFLPLRLYFLVSHLRLWSISKHKRLLSYPFCLCNEVLKWVVLLKFLLGIYGLIKNW